MSSDSENTPETGLPLFKCTSIERDHSRYGLPTATFSRCDGIAGNLEISGSHLMGMDNGQIQVGDKFTIAISQM